MVFASLTFLYLFLPATFAAYFLLRKLEHRNLLLTFASLLFYAWGEPVWVTLLLFSSALDYALARVIENHHGTAKAKVALVASIVSNLGILAVFKYGGMIVETVNALSGSRFSPPGFGLPIGISFYTFQTLSYVIDVHRKQVPAARSYLDFLLFVSLFHQLVAGPIVRYADIADAIRHRTHTPALVSEGVTRFCIGLFKKVFIANVAGELVLKHLDAPTSGLGIADVWLGMLAYTLQIYFDFSGYSDMAIGMGLMNGFRYLENFDHPYVARSVSDFWRRWHISLGTFFRDYVYIPLGGRKALAYRNLFAVWFLTGLWHGASWNYVAWGLFHGLWIALERAGLAKLLERLPRLVSHAYLLVVVMFGWLLFHCEQFSRLSELLPVAVGRTHAPLLTEAFTESVRGHVLWFALALTLTMPVRAWFGGLWQRLEPDRRWLEVVRGVGVSGLQAATVLVTTAQLVGRSYNPFLYFRF